MRTRPADILAIDRLAAPHLTIAEFDAARGRIGLIQHLVMGGHHALQRGNIDAHDQTAPGGGTGNARTTGLQALNQFDPMHRRPGDHRDHARLAGRNSRGHHGQQILPSKALSAGFAKVANLA